MWEWWNAMTIIQQVFVCIAAPATIILVIQSVMLLFGFGFDHADAGGLDADVDADAEMDVDMDAQDGFHGDLRHGEADSGEDMDPGLRLFTVRGLVAFFAVGGWTGLVLSKYLNAGLAVGLAFLAGAAALVGIALLFKYAFRLQDKGNLDVENALGKTGKVYIPVPACEKGQGKITIMLQERLVELDAVTKAQQQIPTGTPVRVSAVIDGQTVQVEPVTGPTNQNRGGISQWIQP